MADTGAELLNAEVVQRIDFTEDLFVLGVRLASQPLAAFKAGQYATLGLPRLDAAAAVAPTAPAGGVAPAPPRRPGLVKRAYSIASGGDETDCYEFLITVVPDGQLTPRLHRLRRGERIWMDPRVRGTFTLADGGAESDVLMLGTGTGLAPFRAMLRSNAMGQRWRRLAIVHGVRQMKDLVYADELLELVRRHASFRYVAAVSREAPTGLPHAVAGRVQAALEPAQAEQRLGFPLDPRSVRVLLCGSPAMINDIKELLAPLGFAASHHDAPGGIFSEKYW